MKDQKHPSLLRYFWIYPIAMFYFEVLFRISTVGGLMSSNFLHLFLFAVIYGLAGSGKTSVGLHRLAYILYHNRNTIQAENILIISNNNIQSFF